MNTNFWTPEEESRLRELYPTTPNRILAEKFGRSSKAISSRAKVLKIKKHPDYDHQKYNITALTDKQHQFIEEHFEQMPYKEIAKILNCGESTIQAYICKNGLKKSTNSGCWGKRHIPWNKGKKIRQHPAAIATQFKPGIVPINTLHDGAITLRHPHKNRGGKQYYFIRLAPKKWIHLHRYLWEKHHGKLPPGMIVTYKDGNTLNCTIENLELISRQENLKRNYDPEKATRQFKELSDNYVAGILSRNSELSRKEILAFHYPLVEAKRLQLKLKRETNGKQNQHA